MRLLFFIIFSLTTFAGFSQQMAKKVQWTTSLSKKEVKVGEEVELIFKGKLEDGWYMYSSDFDPDLGPIVASFNFTENDTYERIGDVKPVGRKEKYDEEIWGGTYTYFTGTAEFRQKVRILKENPVIQVKLTGQVCSEESGACIPVIESFRFDQIKVLPAETGATGSSETGGKVSGGNTGTGGSTGTGGGVSPKEQPVSPCPEGDLQCLQEQRKKTFGKNGEDPARQQLTDFVRKYGN